MGLSILHILYIYYVLSTKKFTFFIYFLFPIDGMSHQKTTNNYLNIRVPLGPRQALGFMHIFIYCQQKKSLFVCFLNEKI